MPAQTILMRRMLFCVLLMCSPFLMQCGCDDGVGQANTEIKAVPDTLTFSGSQGQEDAKSLLIEVKTGPVQINSIAIDQGKSFFRIDPASLPTFPTAYKTGDQITLRVIYSAPAGSAASGRLRVESSAVIPSRRILRRPAIGECDTTASCDYTKPRRLWRVATKRYQRDRSPRRKQRECGSQDRQHLVGSCFKPGLYLP